MWDRIIWGEKGLDFQIHNQSQRYRVHILERFAQVEQYIDIRARTYSRILQWRFQRKRARTKACELLEKDRFLPNIVILTTFLRSLQLSWCLRQHIPLICVLDIRIVNSCRIRRHQVVIGMELAHIAIIDHRAVLALLNYAQMVPTLFLATKGALVHDIEVLDLRLWGLTHCRLQWVKANFVGSRNLIKVLEGQILFILLLHRWSSCLVNCAHALLGVIFLIRATWQLVATHDVDALRLRHKRVRVIEVHRDRVLNTERIAFERDVLERWRRFAVRYLEREVPHVLPSRHLSASKLIQALV